jgi:hypothetical protein
MSSKSLEELNSRVKRLEELLAAPTQLKHNGQHTEALQCPSSEVSLVGPNIDGSEDDGSLCKTVSLMETDDFEHVPPPCGVSILNSNARASCELTQYSKTIFGGMTLLKTSDHSSFPSVDPELHCPSTTT